MTRGHAERDGTAPDSVVLVNPQEQFRWTNKTRHKHLDNSTRPTLSRLCVRSYRQTKLLYSCLSYPTFKCHQVSDTELFSVIFGSLFYFLIAPLFPRLVRRFASAPLCQPSANYVVRKSIMLESSMYREVNRPVYIYLRVSRLKRIFVMLCPISCHLWYSCFRTMIKNYSHP